MKINIGKAVTAGIIGTLIMTAVGVWMAPMMGIPRMNPADMLAQQMGGNLALGWAGHLMIGTILALIYAAVASRLPGPFAVRGALFSLAPFLVAQLMLMPMMGMGVFSGSVAMAMGSLIGHLIYGAIVGSVYGDGTVRAASARRATA
jgi:uncharacterized membrane protein YagU involved in acid resistance